MLPPTIIDCSVAFDSGIVVWMTEKLRPSVPNTLPSDWPLDMMLRYLLLAGPRSATGSMVSEPPPVGAGVLGKVNVSGFP
jgi:hypothetical protein